MTDWREHLTQEEAARLAELDAQAKEASKERRKIFDRARKRLLRSASGPTVPTSPSLVPE